MHKPRLGMWPTRPAASAPRQPPALRQRSPHCGTTSSVWRRGGATICFLAWMPGSRCTSQPTLTIPVIMSSLRVTWLVLHAGRMCVVTSAADLQRHAPSVDLPAAACSGWRWRCGMRWMHRAVRPASCRTPLQTPSRKWRLPCRCASQHAAKSQSPQSHSAAPAPVVQHSQQLDGVMRVAVAAAGRHCPMSGRCVSRGSVR
jgi:hypothetical protein